MTRDVTVRKATVADLPGVLGVLDAAALATDADVVRASIDREDAFVAVREQTADASQSTDGGPVLGALVLAGDEIEAVAVRRRLRGRGIGSALVAAAGRERDRLTAEFDRDVREFYESLGFDVAATGEPGRFRGRKRTDGA